MTQDNIDRFLLALKAAGAHNAQAAFQLVDLSIVPSVTITDENIIHIVKKTMLAEPWAFAEVNDGVVGKFMTLKEFQTTLLESLSAAVPKETL